MSCGHRAAAVQGKVAWLESYGAFVDVELEAVEGGAAHTLSGLIHKSELSWGKVIVPDTVVSVGARRRLVAAT
jgi:ribosomal protein S1